MKKLIVCIFILLCSSVFGSIGFSSSYTDPHYAKMINVGKKYLKHKIVKVYTKKDKILTGKFIDASDFSVLIQNEKGKLVMIPAFNIRYIEEK